MNEHTQKNPDYSFGIGLLTGAVIGAGLAIWLAPRAASELRQRVAGAARSFGEQVQAVRDDIMTAVAKGADEVERYATAGTSAGGTEHGEARNVRPL